MSVVVCHIWDNVRGGGHYTHARDIYHLYGVVYTGTRDAVRFACQSYIIWIFSIDLTFAAIHFIRVFPFDDHPPRKMLIVCRIIYISSSHELRVAWGILELSPLLHLIFVLG